MKIDYETDVKHMNDFPSDPHDLLAWLKYRYSPAFHNVSETATMSEIQRAAGQRDVIEAIERLINK
jgi:hypothetical protein